VGRCYSRSFHWTIFFEEPLKGTAYLAVLRKWLLPELTSEGIMEHVWFQHDGTPAHFARTVRDSPNDNFSARWIGRGSPPSQSRRPWSARSFDLTTPDNSLWRFSEGKVAASRYNTNGEL
jgi:hypothetical protein